MKTCHNSLAPRNTLSLSAGLLTTHGIDRRITCHEFEFVEGKVRADVSVRGYVSKASIIPGILRVEDREDRLVINEMFYRTYCSPAH